MVAAFHDRIFGGPPDFLPTDPGDRLLSEIAPGIEEKRVIGRRAKKLFEAMPALPPMSATNARRIAAASGPLPIAGPMSTHEVDELWSGMHASMPWAQRASAEMWRHMRRAVHRGHGPEMPNSLLYGVPGTGKPTFGRRLAEKMGTPLVEIDLGAGGTALRIAGHEKGWASSTPGLPLEAILRERVANPVILVNGLETGSDRWTGSTSVATAEEALLQLLDRASAKRFTCPSLGIRANMSRVTWILTSNRIDGLDRALLSRVRMFEVPRPAARDIEGLVRRRLEELDAGFVEDAAEQVSRRWSRTPSMTLRQVHALVDRLLAAAVQSRLH